METEYKTWTLRFVPDSVRGEYINIGLIVGCNSADWAIRTVDSFSRANRIGGDANLLNPILRALKTSIDVTNDTNSPGTESHALWSHRDGMTEGRLDDLRRRFNNSLQVSGPHPAFGSSAEEILSLLYPHFVCEHTREAMPRARTRMRNSFRQAIRDIWRNDEVPLYVDPVVVSGGERHEFDFALHATAVEQMTQVISLNRKDVNSVRRDIRAWNYGVTSLRERGAELEMDSHASLIVPRDVEIAVVHDEPANSDQDEVLAEAMHGWRNLGVTNFSSVHIGDAAEQAASSLLAAS